MTKADFEDMSARYNRAPGRGDIAKEKRCVDTSVDAMTRMMNATEKADMWRL